MFLVKDSHDVEGLKEGPLFCEHSVRLFSTSPEGLPTNPTLTEQMTS